jgi:3-hydroxybutyryl-CoA dehydratase
MIEGYFEDHTVGDSKRTRARTVTEADIVAFAGISGDWHPLHTDVEYANGGPFGQRIAHGMLVLTIATGLTPLDYDTVMALYGIDRIRFVKPTKLGETIHVLTEVIETKPRDDESGVVVSQVSIQNAEEELLATAVFRMLVKRAPVLDHAVATS